MDSEEILFVEHDEDVEVSDKPHCGPCLADEVTDLAHCGPCLTVATDKAHCGPCL